MNVAAALERASEHPLAEAIVAPVEVTKYFGEDAVIAKECEIAYNATLMALLWDAVATKNARLLEQGIRSLPGKIARERGHYQAEAINILGWIGILTLGISWFIAIVWAYTKPFNAEAAELRQRVEELEAKLAASAGEEAAQ